MCKQSWNHHQQLSAHQLAPLCPIRTLYITNSKSALSRAFLSSLLSPPLVWGRVKGVSWAELQHRAQGTKLKAAQENARVHPALGKVHSATPEIASHMKTVFVRWEMNCSRRNQERMNHDCFWFENIQDFLCEHFPSAWICRCDGSLKLTDSHSRKFPHLVWEVLWESKESFSWTF